MIISISSVSGFEFDFTERQLIMEELTLDHTYGAKPVSVTILENDGSRFNGECKIDVYLKNDNGRPELYRGFLYSGTKENLIRFPFAILEKYDIIYLKAWFDEGDTLECYRKIPKEKAMPEKVSGKDLGENLIVWYSKNFTVEDCRIERGDDNIMRIGFSISNSTPPWPTEAHSFYMIYNSTGEFTDSFGYIGSAHAEGNSSINNTMFGPTGEMIYYKVTGNLTEEKTEYNLPVSWSYYVSSYGTSGFVNGTPELCDSMFNSRSMIKSGSCSCCWYNYEFPLIEEGENYNCGSYRLKKASGDEGAFFMSSHYNYMDRFAFDGDKKVYTYINYDESDQFERCNPPDTNMFEWKFIDGTKFREYVITGPGFENRYDLYSAYITDVGIIHRDTNDEDVIFWVNNSQLYWNLNDAPITGINNYNYGFDYFKVNDNEIVVLPSSRDSGNKNQKGLRIKFITPDNPSAGGLFRSDEQIIIEDIPIPAYTISYGNYSEYKYALDDFGNIYYIELYRTSGTAIKTRLYYGSFNDLENKEELAQFNFFSVADIESDANGDVWIAYQNRITQIKGKVKELIQLKKEEQENTGDEKLKVEFIFTDPNKQPENYLPIKNDLVPFKIKIIPDNTNQKEVSNKTYTVKLSIKDTKGNPYSPEAEDKVCFVNLSDNIQITDLKINTESNEQLLLFKNYYGVGQIHAEIVGKVSSNIIEIPIDIDNDIIADSWELQYPSVCVAGNDDREKDNEKIIGINDSESGDGFSVFQEYKGIIKDESLNNSFVRLDPTKKEILVFYESKPACNISNSPDSQGLINYLESINIYWIFIQTNYKFIDPDILLPVRKYYTTWNYQAGTCKEIPNAVLYNGILKDGNIFPYRDLAILGFTSPNIIFAVEETIICPNGGGYIRIYNETINNMFNNNLNFENESSYTEYDITFGTKKKKIIFDNKDKNENNYIGDNINVWDLADGKVDNKISHFKTWEELYKYICLHEFGHILGLYDVSPDSNIKTIMIQGLSENLQFYFTDNQKKIIKTYFNLNKRGL